MVFVLLRYEEKHLSGVLLFWPNFDKPLPLFLWFSPVCNVTLILNHCIYDWARCKQWQSAPKWITFFCSAFFINGAQTPGGRQCCVLLPASSWFVGDSQSAMACNQAEAKSLSVPGLAECVVPCFPSFPYFFFISKTARMWMCVQEIMVALDGYDFLWPCSPYFSFLGFFFFLNLIP